MKLSKLYTNKSNVFESIEFNDGLNIIIGEIRHKSNKKKDSHNLGKTTIGLLIDYCLLRKKHKEFFLFKHEEKFIEFVFYLEIKISEGSYLTIRRGVRNNTKIAIHKHSEKHQDYNDLPDDEWSHSDFHSFDRAKESLDSLLSLNFIKPWDYRQSAGYALRSQKDYNDIFNLSKFHYDIDWKPYIAHILGLNFKYAKNQYEYKRIYEKLKSEVEEIEKYHLEPADSLDKLEGLILIREEEISGMRKKLESFDFEVEDKTVNNDLVSNIEVNLSKLNKSRYYVSQAIEKVERSLENHQIVFNVKEAETLFNEAGVLFDGQIKKTYKQLIDFNKKITAERRDLLTKDLEDKKESLSRIEEEIDDFNQRRIEALKFIENKKTFEKYKKLSEKLIDKEAGLLLLKKQESIIIDYEDKKRLLSQAKESLENNSRLLSDNLKQNKSKDSTYSSIRLHFNSIIKSILDKKANIYITTNNEGNLEFRGEIINDDDQITSESDGTTYKKLLCMAFDISVNQVHLNDDFTHFTFHDGFLEILEIRKKEVFINKIREITSKGYQYIGTLIDSDLANQDKSIFTKEEIILTLHDGEDGSLFKGLSW